MPYLCLECGSLEWVESQKVLATYKSDLLDNSDEKIEEDITDVDYKYCAKCESVDLLYFSINDSLPDSEFKNIAKKILELKGKERGKFVLLTILEDWDKEFNQQRIIDEGDFFYDKEELIDYLKNNLGVSEDEIMARTI